MYIAGSIYIHGCPGQRLIPIWLIVFGCFSLLQTLLNTCRTVVSCCNNNDDAGNGGDKASRGGGCCECIIIMFLFAWLIAGSVWVFGYHGPLASQPCVDCCASVPYLFSFWSIIAIFVLSLISCFVCCISFCCCACFLAIAGKSASSSTAWDYIIMHAEFDILNYMHISLISGSAFRNCTKTVLMIRLYIPTYNAMIDLELCIAYILLSWCYSIWTQYEYIAT